VELIFDDLGISLNNQERTELRGEKQLGSDDYDDDSPPQYSSMAKEGIRITPNSNDEKTGNTDTVNLVNQLLITVQHKIADLIINTIRPCITSQALQGSYHTTYVLLPANVQDGVLMSEFPKSNFTEN
jgi:hypothetical protein